MAHREALHYATTVGPYDVRELPRAILADDNTAILAGVAARVRRPATRKRARISAFADDAGGTDAAGLYSADDLFLNGLGSSAQLLGLQNVGVGNSAPSALGEPQALDLSQLLDDAFDPYSAYWLQALMNGAPNPY